MRCFLPSVGAAALLAVAPVASAAPDVHVDAFASTYVPVSVGVAARAELPMRIRTTVGVGTMPGPYLGMINGIATGVGWYDDITGDLIAAALKNSLIIHPRVGWRPVPALGFHADAGYQIATLGGSLSGAETLAVITGQEVPSEDGETLAELEAAASDHMFTIEAGYQWVVKKRLVIDLSLGGMFTVGASSELTPAGDAPTSPRYERRVDLFTAAGEAYLTQTLKSYVHTPTVGIMVGYRFL